MGGYHIGVDGVAQMLSSRVRASHRRFFIDPGNIEGDEAAITGPKARQISRVLRLGPGDKVQLLDGLGNEHHATITDVSNSCVSARIDSAYKCAGEPGLSLTLAVCLPKHDKLDLIVQKVTELGISNLIIVKSQRAVACPNGPKLRTGLLDGGGSRRRRRSNRADVDA